MNRNGELFFKIICLAFSAFLLLWTLIISLHLTEVNQETVEAEAQLSMLRDENERLRMQLENRISLSEIDRYAREQLKMQTPNAGQIIYLDLPGE